MLFFYSHVGMFGFANKHIQQKYMNTSWFFLKNSGPRRFASGQVLNMFLSNLEEFSLNRPFCSKYSSKDRPSGSSSHSQLLGHDS